MTFAITQEEIHRRYRRLTIIAICSLTTVALMAWFTEGDNPIPWFVTMLITAAVAGLAARFGAKRAMAAVIANPVTISDETIQLPWASGHCQIAPSSIQQLTIARRGPRVTKIAVKVRKGPLIPLIGYERMDELAEEIRSRVTRDIVREQ